MEDCIFCKIAKHEMPKEFVYEDDDVMVFEDIHPVRQTHLLIVPKKHIEDFGNLTDDKILLKMRDTIHKLLKDLKLEGQGYRLVLNGGGAQIIDHLHLHLMAPWGKDE